MPKANSSSRVFRLALPLWCLVCGVSARPKVTSTVGGGSSGTGTGGEVVSTARVDASVAGEPSCEELRAMWRFSKRQSRAAEITNEIPTYRDPFANNIWEAPYTAYARSRSMAGMRANRLRGQRPVYGRVVHKPSGSRIITTVHHPERNRAFEEVARLYGNVQRGTHPAHGSSRRITAFRLPGGHTVGLTPPSGSFQHLKELIRTERARELQEQRMAEEIAARAAVLKEMSGHSDSNRRVTQHPHQHSPRYVYDLDSDNLDMSSMRGGSISNSRNEYSGEESPSRAGRTGLLTFPDLLAPASGVGFTNDRGGGGGLGSNPESRFMDEYIYDHSGNIVGQQYGAPSRRGATAYAIAPGASYAAALFDPSDFSRGDPDMEDRLMLR